MKARGVLLDLEEVLECPEYSSSHLLVPTLYNNEDGENIEMYYNILDNSSYYI